MTRIRAPNLIYQGLRRGLQQRPISTYRNPLAVSEEVAEAVHAGKPVVALETTIYTHGESLLTLCPSHLRLTCLGLPISRQHRSILQLGISGAGARRRTCDHWRAQWNSQSGHATRGDYRALGEDRRRKCRQSVSKRPRLCLWKGALALSWIIFSFLTRSCF